MIIKFEGCARCHGDGHELDFKELTHPVEVGDVTFAHWALCPVTQEPILLTTQEIAEDAT